MAYNFIRTRVLEETLPQSFIDQLMNIEEILRDIESNGMVARWKGFELMSNKNLLNKLVGASTTDLSQGFNFIANFEAITLFLGIGFIEGTLLEQ